jgi:hypothetical protein
MKCLQQQQLLQLIMQDVLAVKVSALFNVRLQPNASPAAAAAAAAAVAAAAAALAVAGCAKCSCTGDDQYIASVAGRQQQQQQQQAPQYT